VVIPFVSIWPNLYTPVPEYRSQQYLKWFELSEIYHRTELKKGGAFIDSKIAKIYEVHAGVPSSGAPLFCEGVTNKKTHFKSHVLASPVQLTTTAMA